MIIYKDIISGDELLSDTYKINEVDGIFYEVEGKIKTESTSVDPSLLGANKSAEDTGDDDVEDSGVTGIDIVLNHKLQEVQGFTKKDYKAHIKNYVKEICQKLKENNPDQVAEFQKNAQVGVKKILEKYDDLQLFRGESCDPDIDNGECMLVLTEYRGQTPIMLYFKHGLEEVKV